MERRAFLRGAGIVTVLVAGGGVWRAWDQGVFSAGQGPAYEPWKDWRSASEGPLGLVRAAILAASPHNTQPWLFKVASSSIELYDAIPRRHTNRNPYDPIKPLPGDFAEKVRAVTNAEPDVRIFLFTDEKERKKIAGKISQAND